VCSCPPCGFDFLLAAAANDNADIAAKMLDLTFNRMTPHP
jgi:hypothetical protein